MSYVADSRECVQVNGKLRGTVEVSKQISQADAEDAGRSIASVSKFLDGKPVKKVIFVPGRILNFILGK
jgi:leucyl-tRNA synthetase